VRNEKVGVGVFEHEHLDSVVSFGLLNKRDEIADQFGPIRFIGGAAIFTKRTAFSTCTVSVSKTNASRFLLLIPLDILHSPVESSCFGWFLYNCCVVVVYCQRLLL
jgi:hypothetical protein